MIIYLTQHFPSKVLGVRSRNGGTVMRRYPRVNPERFRGVRTGCPPSVLSCTAWGFSCLANYSTSGELLPRHFTLACSWTREADSFPTLPKNRRCLFCDTF